MGNADREYYLTNTYHDKTVLGNRKTLRNLTMKHFDEGVMSIKRVKDNEVVYAGTYTKLKELYPQLEV
jgi:hypothetical protein